MLMGAMMSSMFMPSYAPMYRTAYVTSPSRVSSISSTRSSYRAANPARFSKPSQSGRSYGGGKSSGGTSRSRGGSRFGIRGGGAAPRRLSAPVPTTIAELPFHERPVVELLALDRGGDPDYAGFGWAKVDRIWLSAARRPARRLDDVLVVAVHASDDGPALDDDVELTFELPGEPGEPSAGGEPPKVRVRASMFLERWLPRLPRARAIVLAMCNPHGASLRPLAAAAEVPVHYGLGDVHAWQDLDRDGRILLRADGWRTLSPVSTELERRPGCVITDDEKQTYAGLYVLKKMDLKPEDGGMVFPAVLPSELSPIDELLQQLAVTGHVVINAKKARWDLTKQGIAYLGEHIDEAADLVDEFEDEEMEDVIAELEARNLDPFRVRFLWGWYDGEFDDLVLYQERRGVKPVERMWAFYLMGDEFWNDLARELEGD